MSGSIKLKLGQWIARYLTKQTSNYISFSTNAVPVLEQWLEPGDILLVEGNTRISTVIKYLTQSTWSHAAFYAGPQTARYTPDGEPCPLIEAELGLGVVASPLSKYRNLNTRICRPVNLTDEDRKVVVDRMVASLGKQYDLKHIFDLARYLVPIPIPARFRRRMIAFGSGDPSRAICSTLIAETYQMVQYPILPKVEKKTVVSPYAYLQQEVLHIRHHSLFTPRDFDLSPYFRVIKPTIECGFDYTNLTFGKPVIEQQKAEEKSRQVTE